MKFYRNIMIAATALCGVLSGFAYTLNVSSGVLPKTVVTANANATVIDAAGYKAGWTQEGWTVERFGTRGFVTVCPTFHGGDTPCESVLTLPAQNVEPGYILRWDARSAMPDFLDSYRVVAVADDKETELYACEAAPAQWRVNVVSLAEFAGKEVTVKFIGTSTCGYMLLLDKVFIGEATDTRVDLMPVQQKFFGAADMTADGKVNLQFSLINSGKALDNVALELRVDKQPVSKYEITAETVWATGKQLNIELSAPSQLNKSTDYELWLTAADGAESLLYADSFYTSNFKRTIMVDEGTGMWCNNCPQGILAMEAMKEAYGGNFEYVCAHVNDILEVSSYWDYLKWNAIPMMMINRIAASKSNTTAKFWQYAKRPVEFAIALKAATLTDGVLRADFEVQAVGDFDNSADRYRIGAVLTQDIYAPDKSYSYQENSSNQPASEQYYMLPSKIPAELAVFHNVPLTDGVVAFEGVPGSLPQQISADQNYSFSMEWGESDILLQKKDLVDWKKVKILAFLIDSESGEVLNVAAGRSVAAGEDSGVGELPTAAAESAGTHDSGIYNLQGIRVADSKRQLSDLSAGFYIVDRKIVRK